MTRNEMKKGSQMTYLSPPTTLSLLQLSVVRSLFISWNEYAGYEKRNLYGEKLQVEGKLIQHI